MPLSLNRAQQIVGIYSDIKAEHPEWGEKAIASAMPRCKKGLGIQPRVLRHAKRMVRLAINGGDELSDPIATIRAITDKVVAATPVELPPLRVAQTGDFTLALADLHLCDVDCLWESFYSTILNACDRINELLKIKPKAKKITVLNGGDWISGIGIFPSQVIRNVIQTPHWQALVGAWVLKLVYNLIEEQTGLKVCVYSVKGNHDIIRGSRADLGYWVWGESQRLGLNAHYSQYDLIVNLGTKKLPYNALMIHGSGASDYSPESPKMVRNITRRVLDLNYQRPPGEQIRRIIHGHVHWFNLGGGFTQCGFEIDSLGGWQRNMRVDLGLTSRPTGMGLYYVDGGNIRVEAVLPNPETLHKETADPRLEFRNTKQIADWLIEAVEDLQL